MIKKIKGKFEIVVISSKYNVNFQDFIYNSNIKSFNKLILMNKTLRNISKSKNKPIKAVTKSKKYVLDKNLLNKFL